jgi:hypothetical protein
MTAQEYILAGVGMFTSLGFSYIPALSKWFYSLDSKYRGLAMVGFSLASSAIIFGISCTGLFSWIACSKDGAVELLKAFLVILVGNQLTYLVSPESPAKTVVKLVQANKVMAEAQGSAMHVSVEPMLDGTDNSKE